MARAIWKGAISFGLVHIPVGLVSAASPQGVDFSWLDKRSMDPVGYKRINKATGKEVTSEDIVKGVQYEKGRYVVLSEEEIRDAHPRATQTIDIFAFVDADDIPLPNIEKPYFLSPERRGEKVYALLRETLVQTGKVALAYVVVRTRQQLAALMPMDGALMLVMLRWPAEVRGVEYLELTDAVTDARLSKQELDMAKRLVEDMASEWNPKEYVDTFEEQIMDLVEEKASKGEIESVDHEGAPAEQARPSNVTDLSELLKRSLGGKAKPGASRSTKADDKPAAKSGSRSSRSKSGARASDDKPDSKGTGGSRKKASNG
jgi:DNA end-binding protein Ku